MQRNTGDDEYHMTIRIHPHHILRENKMMAVAGADRIQDGMRKSFGKPTDRAARVKEGQELVTVRTYARYYHIAIAALKRASDRFPTPCRYKIGKGEELVKELQKTGKFAKVKAKIKEPKEEVETDEELTDEEKAEREQAGEELAEESETDEEQK